MTFVVPETFAAAVQPEALAALERLLAPPLHERARGRYEVEVEAAGEGTFTFDVVDGNIACRKGFAKGDPFCSVRIPKGGWALLRRQLQAAVDGFPNSPELARRQDAARKLKRADIEPVVKGLEKLRAFGIRFDVKGVGTFELARGALDEVTRTLKIALDGAALQGVLDGAGLERVRPELGGDRSVATEVAAALGPVLVRLSSSR